MTGLTNWKGEVPEEESGMRDVDLAGYARSRGLEHRGRRAQMGYVAAFPMTEELQPTVLRGVLPGGEEGVLLHEVKLRESASYSSSHH